MFPMEQVVAAEPRQAQPERAGHLQGLVRKQAGTTVPWRRWGSLEQQMLVL